MDSGADQSAIGGNAWIVLNNTGDTVRCNGYLKGKHGVEGPILPIVSAVTCVELDGREPVLFILHHACYNEDVEQNESLLLPFQAMEHGVTFDTTPTNRIDAHGNKGTQLMIINDQKFHMLFDGRKLFFPIRRPSDDELKNMESFEVTSPLGFYPEEEIQVRRKSFSRQKNRTPGNIPLVEWKRRLALAPDNILYKTFESTTQLSPHVEIENRTIPREHYKSRFLFLKVKRLNDEFHSDTFFPSVVTNQGHTCSQLFIGKSTDFMDVNPMKKESHSFTAL